MAEKLIFLYLILLPLMKVPKPAFMGTKLQYADLIFIPIFIIFLFRKYKDRSGFLRDKINISLILLILVSFLSFLLSPLIPKNGIFLDFAGLVYLVSLFIAITSIINNKKTLTRASFLLFIAALFVSCVGILISVLYNIFKVESLSYFVYEKASGAQSALVPFARPSSLLNLPEMFINFVLLGLSGAFLYRIQLDKRDTAKKRFVDLGITGILLASFMAFSRSLAGVMLFLTLIAFHFFNSKGIMKYILRVTCLSGFLILLLSIIFFWIFTVYPVSFSTGDNAMPRIAYNTNLDTRVYLTKAALAIAIKYPYFGLGLGSFSDNFSSFLSRDDVLRLADIRGVFPEQLKIDPHSLYFGTLAEIGFLGLAVLLLFFMLLIYKSMRAYRLSVELMPFYRNSCFIFQAAFLGLLLNGFFVDILSMRSFWVSLSLVAVTANLVAREKGRT